MRRNTAIAYCARGLDVPHRDEVLKLTRQALEECKQGNHGALMESAKEAQRLAFASLHEGFFASIPLRKASRKRRHLGHEVSGFIFFDDYMKFHNSTLALLQEQLRIIEHKPGIGWAAPTLSLPDIGSRARHERSCARNGKRGANRAGRPGCR